MRTHPAPTRFRLALTVAVALLGTAALAGCAGGGLDALAPGPGPGADPGTHAVSASEREGILPEGTTVSDDHLPGVSGLNPTLRDALSDATTAARDDGVTLTVNSGWRSAQLQSRLLRDAVETYGSPEEAARWVATAETSPHVSGDAVDIGPWAGAEWLGRRGAAFGLCQIYVNEAWHFEYRPEAATQGCPRMYLDPTQDPRMAGE